jgi:hypothetical protein
MSQRTSVEFLGEEPLATAVGLRHERRSLVGNENFSSGGAVPGLAAPSRSLVRTGCESEVLIGTRGASFHRSHPAGCNKEA